MPNPKGHNFTKEERSKGGLASARIRKKNGVKKKQDWDNLGDFILHAGAERIDKILKTQTDDKFMKQYLQLLNYFKPKIQSAIIEQKGSININITSDIKNIEDI